MSELLKPTETDEELETVKSLAEKIMDDKASPQEMQQFDIFVALVQLGDIQSDNMRRIGHENLTRELLAVYGQALSIEVSEFLNEFPWKPWKLDTLGALAKNESRQNAIAEEFADILAFLGCWITILNTVGISPHVLAEAYMRKTAINHARFAGEVEGYGV